MSLYSHNLEIEIWRCNLDGWASSPFQRGAKILIGPVGGAILEICILTGKIERQIQYEGVSGIVGVVDDVVLVNKEKRYDALHRDGGTLWRRDMVHWCVVSTLGRFLVVDDLSTALVCLDALTGAELWRFRIPIVGAATEDKRANVILGGFPSVSVTGDRVLVITKSGRLYTLSLETGEVVESAVPPHFGSYLVTERSIFFAYPFGLSQFDHAEMKEIEHIEYRAEVEPLYKGNRPTLNAFCVTEESIVWTTMHGSLMGVSRRPGTDGKRFAWTDEIQGALFPIAVAPFCFGKYFYCIDRGANPALHCYRSVSSQEY